MWKRSHRSGWPHEGAPLQKVGRDEWGEKHHENKQRAPLPHCPTQKEELQREACSVVVGSSLSLLLVAKNLKGDLCRPTGASLWNYRKTVGQVGQWGTHFRYSGLAGPPCVPHFLEWGRRLGRLRAGRESGHARGTGVESLIFEEELRWRVNQLRGLTRPWWTKWE